MMSLKDQVVIVTGAGRGIGRQIAISFAQAGAIPVLFDLDAEGVRAVHKELADSGLKSLPLVGSVASEDDVKQMVAATLKELGRVDILVNNAGISPKKDGRRPNVPEIELQEWNQVLAVNLTGVFLCCKAVLPHMEEKKYGRIVNISSSAALDGGFLAGPHYVASKGAVSAFTMSLAKEAAPYNITVNAVAPGRIQSPMAKLTSEKKNQEAMARIPVGRFGMPEDVAESILYLASEKAGYVTGITLNLSGGQVMG
ncbi:MAG: SDR family oxidoreductase [Proteobacteria bacterium]|nr:SDR family oxidoreductase [Pseudomonadota bacterium]MBU4577128.1 SDR family oxidoreductase [Pseudomonadota bacterium]MBV1717023.1 SDR family oxidoreductase [Desulfarculus sp.]